MCFDLYSFTQTFFLRSTIELWNRADLAALAKEAAVVSINRIFSDLMRSGNDLGLGSGFDIAEVEADGSVTADAGGKSSAAVGGEAADGEEASSVASSVPTPMVVESEGDTGVGGSGSEEKEAEKEAEEGGGLIPKLDGVGEEGSADDPKNRVAFTSDQLKDLSITFTDFMSAIVSQLDRMRSNEIDGEEGRGLPGYVCTCLCE